MSLTKLGLLKTDRKNGRERFHRSGQQLNCGWAAAIVGAGELRERIAATGTSVAER